MKTAFDRHRLLGEVVLLVFSLLQSVVIGKYDCYDRHRHEYVGNSTALPTECAGCACLAWPPEYGLPENYCRFVNGWELPRCMVNNYLGLHLEDCDIPACDIHTTCYHGDGSEYRDGGQFTESGYRCLVWDDVHDQEVDASLFPTADLIHNFCRNPNGRSRPWCYFYANGTVEQDFCPIERCGGHATRQFDQFLSQTIIPSSLTAHHQQAVFLAPGDFSVEACLEACLAEGSACRSVVVDTFRRSCTLSDMDPSHAAAVPYKYADVYNKRGSMCDAFQFDTFGPEEDCLLPLGMEVGLIRDSHITASSYVDDDHAPWEGRLNGNSSWMPHPQELGPSETREARPYLQMDFLERMKVTGLVVQGGGIGSRQGGLHWVEELQVLVTHDPVDGKWDKMGIYQATVKEDGSTFPKTFDGNKESMCMVAVMFEYPLYTRYLRVHPTKWNMAIALRLEVIGCRDTGCESTLGMISGQILDGDIVPTSVDNEVDPHAQQVRLSPFSGSLSVGWVPSDYDLDPGVRIDLQRPHALTAVVTQGCSTGGVTSVRVRCHDAQRTERETDPSSPYTLATIESTEVIGGSSSQGYIFRHSFGAPITCELVFVQPVEWTGTRCMRVELTGCLHSSGCNQRLGVASGRITDSQLSSQRNDTHHYLDPDAIHATPRLHQWAGLSSGWVLGASWRGDWLQVDLLTPHTVTGLEVQAGRLRQYSTWVDEFRVLYTVASRGNGTEPNVTGSWKVYRNEDGSESLFHVARSPYTVTYHTLSRSFITDKLRIEPVSWSSVYPGLRFEVIGCELAEYGELCSESAFPERGLCLGKVDTDSAGACSEILGHHATPVVIHYPDMLGGFLRDDAAHLQRRAYLIGLTVVLGDFPSDYADEREVMYTWVDGSGLTYGNFQEKKDHFSSKDPGWYCTAMDNAEPYTWMLEPCAASYDMDRGTICQYDLDECLGNHGCSHECFNYPAGYQCRCPYGYVLDRAAQKECIPLCSYLDSHKHTTWLQRDKWCYTEAVSPATWHDANSACLAYGSGSRLPGANTEFWDYFDASLNLTWIAQQRPRAPAAIDCHAVTPGGPANNNTLPCTTLLHYVCILEFETIGDYTSQPMLSAEGTTDFGLLRTWYYPPHTFTNTLTIALHFIAPENHIFRFDNFQMSLKGECQDNFTVFDKYPDGSTTFRGTFCDLDGIPTGYLISQSSSVEVILKIGPHTRGRQHAVGLEFVFTAVDCGDQCSFRCGPTPPVLTLPNGSIDILDISIPPYTSCTWLINVENGKFINLSFTDYQFDETSTLLIAFDEIPSSGIGNLTNHRLYSSTSSPPNVISDLNKLTVRFSTGSRAELAGFRAQYKSVDIPGCNSDGDYCHAQCRAPSAYLTTPSYPSIHLENWSCTLWMVSLTGTYIELVFDVFDIPSSSANCRDSRVTVMEGDYVSDEVIGGPFCSNNPPGRRPVRSSLNALTVHVETVVTGSGRGFLARYQMLYFQPRREVVVTSENCESGWYYYDQHCYGFNATRDAIRWTDAETACKSTGTHLVSIRDIHEAEYVHYMLTAVWWTQSTLTYIGLGNRDNQGLFRWSDGGAMTYTDWTIKVKDDSEEDVAERFEYVNPNGGVFQQCTLYELSDAKTTSNWVDDACAALVTNSYVCKTKAADYVSPPVVEHFVGVEKQRCPSHLFSCGSGECIHTILQCDSSWDCADGSDEENTLCSFAEFDKFRFSCDSNTGGMQLIPASFYCNFVDDCLNGADEIDCVQQNCSDSQFRCDNGQCLDESKRCDLTVDCFLQGADASDCEMYLDSFQCYSGHWIPEKLICDAFPDCIGQKYEDEASCDPTDYEDLCEVGQLKCRNGKCVDRRHQCVYDLDSLGYMIGCRDATHLRNCELFQCPERTFKCPNSYCIPVRFRCDEKWDCPNGEDERECADYVCAGAYKCMHGDRCISLDKVCDGIYDCFDEGGNGRDDELFCDLQCPVGCVCVGLSYSCDNSDWSQASAAMIPRDIRQLFLNSVFINVSVAEQSTSSTRKKRESIQLTIEDLLFITMGNYPWILDVQLRNNGIVKLEPGMFSQNRNMQTLDLSGNKIQVLSDDTFLGLSNLRRLYLADNELSQIEVGAFAGLKNLLLIDMTNAQPVTSRAIFDDLDNLDVVVASQYLFCCLKKDISDCVAPVDQFSDCDALISNNALLFFIWVLGLSALVGNLFVFGLRTLKRRRRADPTPVQTFLITNLAVSDFLMGVYMIIIAGANSYFRDNYALAAAGWRASIACTVAGILAVISSEVSVFVVMILSIDRFVKIVFPFRFGLHLSLNRAHCLMIVSWVVGVLISVLPAVIPVYFSESYYGSSSVCLALPLVPELPHGWQYMFFVLGVNLVSFLVMLVCYTAIFVAVKQSSRSMKGGKVGQSSQRAADVRIATKMALIVGTDFICWMPIIIMAVLASAAKVAIPQEVYAWIAVFVLPLNSSINPYLYTLSTYWGNRKKKKKKAKTSLVQNQMSSPALSRTLVTNPGAYSNDGVSDDAELQPLVKTVLAQLEKHRVVPTCKGKTLRPPSPENIPSSPCGTSGFVWTEDNVASIEEDVAMALSWLHMNQISGIQLTEDSILSEKDANGRQRAYLKIPQRTVGDQTPNGKARVCDVDMGVELDNKALKNLIGRLRKNVSITHKD